MSENTLKVDEMRHQMKQMGNKGQQILEYAIIASVVAAVALAMSTYVFRSVQATQQAIQKEAGNE